MLILRIQINSVKYSVKYREYFFLSLSDVFFISYYSMATSQIKYNFTLPVTNFLFLNAYGSGSN